jgi:hypothetical protein
MRAAKRFLFAICLVALPCAGAEEPLDDPWNRAGAEYPLVVDPLVSWNQETELTQSGIAPSQGNLAYTFGWSVSVSGNTAVVGADDMPVNGSQNQGAAYVFVNNGGTWSQQAELTASDGASSDNFGYSVAVSGNTIVVGAPSKIVNGNDAQGAVYVFVESGGAWSQQAELTASDGRAVDALGTSVSLSGNTIVAGAGDKGAAYVFVENGNTWTQQAELTGPGGPGYNQFGTSVSVSGDTAVIGAPEVNANQGAVYVFVQNGAVWSQQAELTASDGASGDYFGWSVSLSGNAFVAGAWGKTVNGNVTQGAAYVFGNSGGVWSEQAELTASNGAGVFEFGRSVSLSGDRAAVGANDSTVGVTRLEGTAYVFGNSGGIWSQQAELASSDGAYNDNFGWSVSVSGTTLVVGAYDHSVNGNTTGAAYVFNSSTAIPASQTIDFGPLSSLQASAGAPPFAIGAIATSGLPVSFTALNEGFRRDVVCRVSGEMVTLLAMGQCTIQATQAGNADYYAAPPVNRTIEVATGDSEVYFGPLPDRALGSPPFLISATASPGQGVSFYSTTLAVCTVSRQRPGQQDAYSVQLIAVGQCTIEASGSDTVNYYGSLAIQSFQVTP